MQVPLPLPLLPCAAARVAPRPCSQQRAEGERVGAALAKGQRALRLVADILGALDADLAGIRGEEALPPPPPR